MTLFSNVEMSSFLKDYLNVTKKRFLQHSTLFSPKYLIFNLNCYLIKYSKNIKMSSFLAVIMLFKGYQNSFLTYLSTNNIIRTRMRMISVNIMRTYNTY